MNQAHALQPQPRPLRASPAAPRVEGRAGIAHLAHTFLLEIAVFAAMVLRFLPEPLNVSSFLILCAVAFAGRRGTILAMAGVWFVHSVNPGFAGETLLGSGGRYLVIAAAVVAAAFRGMGHTVGEKVSIASATTAAVAGAVLVHSALFSQYPSLSIFKAGLWGAVSLTLVTSIRGLSDEDYFKLNRFLLLFFGAILVPSLAVMPFAEARLINDVGLQGLLNHPQMFGVFCALAGAYYFGTAIASPKPSWIALAMVAFALQGALESQARAGGFALVLGCVAVVALAAARPAVLFRQTMPGLFSGRFGLLCFLLGVIGLANAAMVSETAAKFLNKRGEATEFSTAYETTRGWMIQDMFDNIEEHPVTGIGLGIQSATHLMDIEFDSLTGLPVSAGVEKGVMWVAFVEELGLILGLLLFGWVAWGTAQSITVAAAPAAAAIAYFLTNFAEATFFSPGGVGMIGLIIFYIGIARAGQGPERPAPLPLARPA